MDVRSVLANRWIGCAGLVLVGLLVTTVAVHVAIGRPAPGPTHLPVAIAVVSMGIVGWLGLRTDGASRTPYW